ncbi:MAG: hypothetical protein LBS95_02000 [Mycoplasmataceae bacterium]|jgi:alanine dehydrogenase|nr:hypothetical protein [Mycoplasmataceae bacterium]
MKIAVLKENKKENRIGLIPHDIKTLLSTNEIYVEKSVKNIDKYISAGAKMFNKYDILTSCDVIIKLSPLTNKQAKYIKKPEQLIITNSYLANNPMYLKLLLKKRLTSIGLELIHEKGAYYFLMTNEQIKGKFGVILAGYYLSALSCKFAKGKAIANIHGIKNKTNYLIINYSYAAYEAIKVILSLGGNVTILENNKEYVDLLKNDKIIHELIKNNDADFAIKESQFDILMDETKKTDVLINTTTVPGENTHLKITSEMIRSIPDGGVYIDLGADQGFSSEVFKKPNTIKKPYTIYHNKICIAFENIPSFFANTMSEAISEVIAKIIHTIEKDGTMLSNIKNNHLISQALQTFNGDLTNDTIARALNLKFKKL